MGSKLQTIPELTGLYIRNLAANLIGNLIILLLNIFTPLEFLKDWRILSLRGAAGYLDSQFSFSPPVSYRHNFAILDSTTGIQLFDLSSLAKDENNP